MSLVNHEEMLAYFAELGFEETEIEDGLTALCFEESPDGSYVLLTDEEGSWPGSLDVPLTLACYSPENAFCWSVGFKTAATFKAVWTSGGSFAEKIARVQSLREPEAQI